MCRGFAKNGDKASPKNSPVQVTVRMLVNSFAPVATTWMCLIRWVEAHGFSSAVQSAVLPFADAVDAPITAIAASAARNESQIILRCLTLFLFSRRPPAERVDFKPAVAGSLANLTAAA